LQRERQGDEVVSAEALTRLKIMKLLKATLFILILSLGCFAADIKSADELVAAMHKKYSSKWYKTLTFVQKTITHKPDGTSSSEIWYEALSAPGKLRIDIEPLDKHNGILFADGKLYSYRDGKLAGSRAFVHPLLVLGFDAYVQPPATMIAQLKGLGLDMTVFHEDTWQGQPAYVVGAKQGDVSTPQFWVTKKDVLFVRLIQLVGRDKKVVQETQFNKYVKVGGGWVSAEVTFFADGKLVTSEEYSDIQAGMALDANLWNPEAWMTVDRSYYKKK
jgi:outer membrane lipoprotein-sorting protein